MRIILLTNGETELNQYDCIGIWLNASESHGEMKITHSCVTQGYCEWKRKYQESLQCLDKASYLQLKKVLSECDVLP